jgi:hypothetical protein
MSPRQDKQRDGGLARNIFAAMLRDMGVIFPTRFSYRPSAAFSRVSPVHWYQVTTVARRINDLANQVT